MMDGGKFGLNNVDDAIQEAADALSKADGARGE